MPQKRRARNVDKNNAEGDSEQQPRKSRVVRGKRGSLESLPRMPLDVIIETIRYLKPLDLLHLARTSRDFRNFLMARSAAPFWKTARRNVKGLPDCAPHLSEPAYANLMFDKHCHSCLKPGVNIVLWPLSARYCKSCKTSKLRRCWGSHCLFSARNCISGRLRYSIEIQRRWGKTYWHHEPEIANLEAIFPIMDQQALDALEEANRAIMEHAKLCEEWQRSAASSRQEELEDLRAQRWSAVLAKLTEHGYGDELDLMHEDGRLDELRRHAFFNQPKPMTERMWLNGKDVVLQHMKSLQDDRIHQERADILRNQVSTVRESYREWRRTHSNRNRLPLDMDILCDPDYVSGFNSSAYTDVDAAILPEDFADRARQWRDRCDETLRTKVRNSSELRELLAQDVDPLTLAVVAFSCINCAANHLVPPLYPSVISHKCCNNGPGDSCDLAQITGIDQHLASIISDVSDYQFPWSSDALELGLWYRRAAEIIKACGEDPSTITREEMDALPVRLWCTCCSRRYSSGDIRRVMTWRDAFSHYTFHDGRNGKVDLDYAKDNTMRFPLKWARMSGHRVSDIIAMEEVLSLNYYNDVSKTGAPKHPYRCAHCDLGTTGYLRFIKCHFHNMANHLRRFHDIVSPSEHDMYQHPDAEPYTTRPVILVRSEDRRLSQEALDKQVGVIQELSKCYAPPFSYDF